LKGIDRCWEQKFRGILRPEEKKEAANAYEAARVAYRKILAESPVD
jgi:hypothetical protein